MFNYYDRTSLFNNWKVVLSGLTANHIILEGIVQKLHSPLLYLKDMGMMFSVYGVCKDDALSEPENLNINTTFCY